MMLCSRQRSSLGEDMGLTAPATLVMRFRNQPHHLARRPLE